MTSSSANLSMRARVSPGFGAKIASAVSPFHWKSKKADPAPRGSMSIGKAPPQPGVWNFSIVEKAPPVRTRCSRSIVETSC